MRIAMVSEHASPLAALGGDDAGGQNVHVAALARALAAAVTGHRLHPPRRPGAAGPGAASARCRRRPRAGRAPRRCRRTSCCRYMPAFGRRAARPAGRPAAPDVVHAHFWMSGLAATGGCPRRSASRSSRRSTRSAASSGGTRAPRTPARRSGRPRGRARRARATRVVATCTDEVRELCPRCAGGADARRPVRCGRRPRSAPAASRCRAAAGAAALSRRPAGRPQGVDDGDRGAGRRCPDAELVVAGGPARRELDRDPEARGCAGRADEPAWPTGCGSSARSPAEDLPALMRSADVVVCRALVRAVRHRAAGGDGLRRAGRRLGGRRACSTPSSTA